MDKNASRPPTAAEKRDEKERLDKALDQALKDSFPASDPINIVQPPHSKEDKDDN